MSALRSRARPCTARASVDTGASHRFEPTRALGAARARLVARSSILVYWPLVRGLYIYVYIRIYTAPNPNYINILYFYFATVSWTAEQ